MTDIWFWTMRLGKKRFNGQPLREFANETELTMQSDAGDLGWGAHSEDGPEGGWQQHGELPSTRWTRARQCARSRASCWPRKHRRRR